MSTTTTINLNLNTLRQRTILLNRPASGQHYLIQHVKFDLIPEEPIENMSLIVRYVDGPEPGRDPGLLIAQIPDEFLQSEGEASIVLMPANLDRDRTQAIEIANLKSGASGNAQLAVSITYKVEQNVRLGQPGDITETLEEIIQELQ